MKFIKLIAVIIFTFVLTMSNALCEPLNSGDYKIHDLIVDNSDNMVLIRGEGNFKDGQTTVYIPAPGAKVDNSLNLITNITTFTINSPARYVVDVPNAVLIGTNRNYKLENSMIQNIALSQFSVSPNIVRIVFTLSNTDDISKFRTYTNGKDIVVKYGNQIVENSIQYKFYTTNGDFSKNSAIQNTGATLSYNATLETKDMTPHMQTRYYLNKISQNSDGLILRGLGQISMQKASYLPDNTQMSVVLDSTSMPERLDNKSYNIPSSDRNISATLTINRINSKKVKLTLNGNSLRDYRFVVSPDGQSLFISHRTYVINTTFSSKPAVATSYKFEKTQNGYSIIDMTFNDSATYDVFELNDNFYLDINNLGDYNLPAFSELQRKTNIKVQALKISHDKTRYIIPMDSLNFAYANVESNAKSIKLCFKDKLPIAKKEETQVNTPLDNKDKTVKDDSKSGNINVVYIPKEEENKRIERPKKRKEHTVISSMKKVVIDPGHGGADSGAIGGGLYEKDLNLIVAKLVRKQLEKKNIHVYMTRTKDETLTLEDRVNYSNDINPDIFVSIHTNSTVKEDSYGLETHYYKDNSLQLARTIHSEFASEKNLKRWKTLDRGVIKSRFYVINHTEAPSVLIEMGFISNLDERVKLFSEDRQEEIAKSIVEGILEYLRVK